MKLVSLNVEGAKHLVRFIPFLEKERPDAVCLQELFEKDGRMIAEKLGMHFAFAPMTLYAYDYENGPTEPLGVGILSRIPLSDVRINNYYAPPAGLVAFDVTNEETKRQTQYQTLLSGNLLLETGPLTLLTTHFTWTPDGRPNAYQETDAEALLSLLSGFPRFALCGDFNIPRDSHPLYERFASRYTDAIPHSYASSLDLTLHRVKADPSESARLAKFMVDYLFLERYRAENVRLEFGVSDHAAIVGDVFAE